MSCFFLKKKKISLKICLLTGALSLFSYNVMFHMDAFQWVSLTFIFCLVHLFLFPLLFLFHIVLYLAYCLHLNCLLFLDIFSAFIPVITISLLDSFVAVLQWLSRDSLQSHGLHHARLPCPSPSPGVYSNSRSLSRWCHGTISSSVVPFSSCPQSFPASGSFASSGQSIRVSASVLAMNIQGWFPLRLTVNVFF